jgi:hypothetical protein
MNGPTEENEMSDGNGALPAYANADTKAALLAQGSSGTIYALVMPESEIGIQRVVDGGDGMLPTPPAGHRTIGDFVNGSQKDLQTRMRDAMLEEVRKQRDAEWLSMFREPWTQKQDDIHVEYFDRWIEWASPIVRFDAERFPFRYPTAGASQGIEKLLAEYITRAFKKGITPTLHVFEGEYEGFAAYARGLECEVEIHERSDWRSAVMTCQPGFFFVSQPSAIDGMVWDDFDAFCAAIDEHRMGQIEVVPDLTYVGSTAREWTVSMDHHCIRAFVISHSKPFGLYYHRVGGVFARDDRPTLYGNVWFKNLTSIRIGIEMMREHGVYDLPRRYIEQQRESVLLLARRLRLNGLKPSDISVMGQAPVQGREHPLSILERGCADERIVRVCLTPQMTVDIDRDLAPDTAQVLGLLRDDEDTRLLEMRSPLSHAGDGDRRLFEARCTAAIAAGERIRVVLHEWDMDIQGPILSATTHDVLNQEIAQGAIEIVLQADDGTIVLMKGFDA